MTAPATQQNATARAAPAGASPGRDIRLDVFRGLAMCIILISHAPGNPWASWIPARFGFSDATEMFVFLSGMASAIAFGAVFRRAGWAMGAARVAFRAWQIYWVHIGLFVALFSALIAIDLNGAFEKVYVDTLGLGWFLGDPGTYLVGLFTLTWVPNYFDILPMYLVILLMLPGFVALARIDPRLALSVSAGIWLVAQTGVLALPADPVTDREWFFNPFGWQLLFFTGFSFMAGWLLAPPVRAWLIALAVAYVVLTTPLSSGHVVGWMQLVWPAGADWAMAVYPDMEWLRSKTEQGILRFAHFLALAYLAWILCGAGGARLRALGEDAAGRFIGAALRLLVRVGQQTLAVFTVSMIVSRFMGLALDQLPEGVLTTVLVNVVGLATLVATAYVTAWYKSQPWRVRPNPQAARSGANSGAADG